MPTTPVRDPLPSPSGYPLYMPARAPQATEQHLVAHVLAYAAEQGMPLSPLLLIDYVVALKTSPFVLLFGPAGQGKTELTRMVAEALIAPWPEQYGYVNLGVAIETETFVHLQDRFGWMRFLEFLEQAAAPANVGRVFFLCLDNLRPPDITTYFSLLVQHAHETHHRLALPGYPLHQRPIVPPNILITGTIDASLPEHVFQAVTAHHASWVYVQHHWLGPPAPEQSAAPTLSPVGLQRLLVQQAIRTDQAAMERLQDLLGEEYVDELLHPPAPLLAIMWRAGLTYDHQWRSTMLRTVANSFAVDGRGLFDGRSAEANARFALAFGLARQMLVRLYQQPTFEPELNELVRSYVTHLPSLTLTPLPTTVVSG